MTLKEMVTDGKLVRFMHYRDGELTYQTEDGFQFPVPVSDTGTGTFKAEDKAILFMRWIRKQLDVVKSWQSEQEIEEEAYATPDSPMSPAAVKVFNSIVFAHIPEENILRDYDEDQP